MVIKQNKQCCRCDTYTTITVETDNLKGDTKYIVQCECGCILSPFEFKQTIGRTGDN